MFGKIKKAMMIQPAIAPITDKALVAKNYKYWRMRIMYSTVAGYAVYYFVRKNFSMANKPISQEFGFTTTEMGMILSVATIVYAFSKFLSGVLADRMNPRYLLAIGLLVSAVINFIFPLSSALWIFIILWAVNNLFQGMGVPPCSKLLVNWFSPTEIGKMWGVWNASHQIGGAVILVFAGYLVANYGWRSAFYVPAAIALIVSLWLFNRLRDNPRSLGLPSVEVHRGDVDAKIVDEYEKEKAQASFWSIFKKHILKNKLIWIVCFANFFIYIVRIGVLDWAPRFLQESKGFSPIGSGWASATFEIIGILGALLCGAISDKVFKGRRGPVAAISMMFLIVSCVGLIVIPAGHPILTTIVLIAIGFFVYGPQLLVAVAAADFATTEAAATAVGLTGFFGYIGASVCGIGTGFIVQHFGWNGGFAFWIASAVIGTILFLFTWNHRSPLLEGIHANGNGKGSK